MTQAMVGDPSKLRADSQQDAKWKVVEKPTSQHARTNQIHILRRGLVNAKPLEDSRHLCKWGHSHDICRNSWATSHLN